MAQIIIKSSKLEVSLLKAKDELEKLLCIIRDWRLDGVNGSGVIPISVLPLEDKLKKSIADIEAMIKVVKKI